MYRVLNEDVCFLVSLSNVIGLLKKKEALFMHSHSSHMDERLLKRLFEAYSNDLLYYAQYLVRSREEAEEIVSDVFFEVWQHRDRFSEVKNEKAWLLKVTHNKVVSWLRKNGNGQVLVPWDEVGDYGTLVDLQTPDSRIISREEISRINQVVNQLPPRCRQVFVLAKIEKLPYKEIAEVLGISVKTINIHVAKALEFISSVLK